MTPARALLALLLPAAALAADFPPSPLRSYLPKAANAKPASLGPFAVRYLHIDGLTLKILRGFPAAATTDGQSHDLYVGALDDAAVCFVLASHEVIVGDIKGLFFKADLNGRLKRAAGISAFLGEDGQPAKGSGRISPLDETDPDVIGKFRHELEFWTKGKYRKAPSAAQAGSKGA